MASNDNCLSEGPYGIIILIPSTEFIIPPLELNSQVISIIFTPKPDYSPELGDVVAIVEIKDSQERILTTVGFEVSESLVSLYNFTVLSPGRFQITIPASSIRRDGNTFQFKITTTENRQFIQCATINVDAIASGYGFVYNYFQITEYTPTLIEPGPIEEVPEDEEQGELLPQSILFSETSYNFYDEKYESQIASNNATLQISENILPNINILNTVYSYNNNSDLNNLYNLAGLIDGQIFYEDTQLPKSNNKISKIVGNYFEEFKIDIVDTLINEPTYFTENNLTNFKYFLFPKDYETNLYKKNDKNKFLFPMYVHILLDQELARNINVETEEDLEKSRIFFDSRTKRKFNSTLDEFGLLDYFLYCIMWEFSQATLIPLYSEDVTRPSIINKYLIQNNSILNESKDCFYLGNIDNISSYDQSPVVKFLAGSMLKTEFIEDQIIMYEIEKSINGNILQKYFIMNNSSDAFIRFFDTQIKYDSRYEYKIYQHYTYTEQKSRIRTVSNGRESARQLYNYKEIFIKRKLVEKTSLRVLDNPPIKPEVQFIPFKGIDNELLLLLNNNIGKIYDYPVKILNEDQIYITKSILNQGKSENEKIKFQSDDLIDLYQIFRLDSKPKNYADFTNAVIKEVSTELNGINRNAASIIDNIEPNKKYYYIIRAKDVHGNISNPSIPYEVELINDSGTIYLIIKEYILKQENTLSFKQFKNKLQISISSNQSNIIIPELTRQEIILNRLRQIDANSAFYHQERIIVGEKNNNIWDKKFVIKLTSKLTGKKVDINFNFQHVKNIRES